MKKEKTITITIKEYKRLLKRDKELMLLEAGGVDNWEFYSDALHPDWPEDAKSLEDYEEEIDNMFPDE